MERQRRNAVRHLALVVGLASAMVAVLLWGAGRGAPSGAAAQAPQPPDAGSLTEPLVAARYSDISAAWTSTEPVTTEIIDVAWEKIWPISQYGVTVTFPGGSLGGPSVFTFTPKLSDTLPLPSFATPYFFDIRGTYKAGGGEVSPQKRIWVDIKYDELTLGPVIESTLHIYRWRPFWVEWSTLSSSESSTVTPASNLFRLEFRTPGYFGIGGYQCQVFLPVVIQSAVTAGSP